MIPSSDEEFRDAFEGTELPQEEGGTDYKVRMAVRTVLEQNFLNNQKIFSIVDDGETTLAYLYGHELRKCYHPAHEKAVPLLLLSFLYAAHLPGAVREKLEEKFGEGYKVQADREETARIKAILDANGSRLPSGGPDFFAKFKKAGWRSSFLLPLYVLPPPASRGSNWSMSRDLCGSPWWELIPFCNPAHDQKGLPEDFETPRSERFSYR
jgi:hypothetical protein